MTRNIMKAVGDDQFNKSCLNKNPCLVQTNSGKILCIMTNTYGWLLCWKVQGFVTSICRAVQVVNRAVLIMIHGMSKLRHCHWLFVFSYRLSAPATVGSIFFLQGTVIFYVCQMETLIYQQLRHSPSLYLSPDMTIPVSKSVYIIYLKKRKE